MKSEKVGLGKKIACIIGISLSAILIVVAFSGRYFNSGFKDFANFFLGSFGMSFYGLMAAVIVTCSFVLAGKSVKIPVKYAVHFALMFVAIVLFVHTLTTTYLPQDFSRQIGLIYHYYDGQMGVPTFGGVVFGIIAYALKRAITIYGAMVLIVGLLGWTVYVCADFFYKYFTGKLSLTAKSVEQDIEPSVKTTEIAETPSDTSYDARQKAYQILFEQQEKSIYPESVVSNRTEEHFDVAEQSRITSDSAKTVDRAEAENILFGEGEPRKTNRGENSFFAPEKQDDEFIVRGYYQSSVDMESSKSAQDDVSSDWKIVTPKQTEPQRSEPKPPVIKDDPSRIVAEPPVVSRSSKSVDVDVTDVIVEDEPQPVKRRSEYEATPKIEEVFVESAVEEVSREPVRDEEPIAPPIVKTSPTPTPSARDSKKQDDELIAVMREDPVDGGMQLGLDFTTKEEMEKVHKYLPYNKPPFELLNDVTITEDYESGDRKHTADAIVNKLSVFGIKVENVDIIVGPSVTRYTFRVLSQKTRMGDFRQYADDIKACVEAQEDIRIEAPIHGTGLVGIEVANKKKTPVVLRGLLDSDEFAKGKGNLVFAIGREITGKVIVADLADMPHLLIAGTTGSGKSVCLNCLIVSFIYKYGPEYVRFLMVDPKFVELSRYNGIPHMLTAEAITNVQDALAGMDYLIAEMESRYQLFRQSAVGNISEYNSRINPKITQKLPYLVFVVDELADLMSVSKKAFEQKLMRLAQKSRAAGIHIVLATQRPSVDVITGTIKANLPCRMALKVASQADSSTILNGGGAEKLLGKGDMLFLGSGASDTLRVQGAYISNDEIRALKDYTIASNEIFYDQKVTDAIFVSNKPEDSEETHETAEPASKEAQLDPYCKKALRFWLEKQGGRASIASIQRNLGIGFNRAGRIMDSMQKLKYVEELSPSDPSSKPLRVLVSLDDLDELFPDMQD